MNVPKERAQQSGAASSAAADLISCPTCQHDAPATFRFCAECGTRLPFFRPQQIIDQKYQVVRLVSQDNDSDVYEIRRLHDNASQAPGSQLSMSPDRAAAAVPAAVMPCPTCQHDAPASFRFCPECGTRLPFLRPQQIIDQKYQVVRLISQGNDTDVYEIRKVHDNASQATGPRSPMSPNIAAAAVPVAAVHDSRAETGVSGMSPNIAAAAVPVAAARIAPNDHAEIGAPAPVPHTATPATPPIAFGEAQPASAATRDVSGQNRYNPLARKRPGAATIIGVLILAALVTWAVVIMTRPAPDTLAGERAVTSTAQAGGEVDVIAEDTSTVAPVVTLPPNIDPSAVSGEGSILREVPVDAADIPLPTPTQQTVQQTAPTPAAQRAEPPPAAGAPAISERRAVNILVSGVNRTDYYGLDHRCIGVGSSSFVNEGYTIELVTRPCPGSNRPPGSLLGRWRVDAKTGDAYVQNASGKYVSP